MRKMITENLAMGLINTEKPLVYAVINTANFDVMGYTIIAMEDSSGLEDIGCLDDDIDAVDGLPVGGTYSSLNWPAENAIIIVKIRDERQKM